MTHRGLDAEAIERLLDAATDRLEGEWILVGGALAAIWFSPTRVTEDVDLVGLAGTNEQRLALMRLAQDVGLPIEAVNSAADFFVLRNPRWRDDIEVLRRGPRSVLYRPTPTFFLLLKMRLGEQDLDDCLKMIEHASDHGLALDRARVIAAIDALAATEDAPLRDRRARLRARLAT